MKGIVGRLCVYGVVFWPLGFLSAMALLCCVEAANFAGFLPFDLQNSLLKVLDDYSLQGHSYHCLCRLL
jgi:hypothetical protein